MDKSAVTAARGKVNEEARKADKEAALAARRTAAEAEMGKAGIDVERFDLSEKKR